MSRTALLDVNVLLALFDPEHVHHDIAHDWFAESCTGRWASCPVTENGFLRTANVAAQKSEFVPTASLIDHLRRFQAAGRHEFWNDDVSVLDEARFEAGRLGSAGLSLARYNHYEAKLLVESFRAPAAGKGATP